MKTFQYRLKPTKRQVKLIKEQLEVHRNLYNQCLEERISAYKEGVSISCFDQIKSVVPTLKGKSNYSAMQQTVRRLDKTYKSSFRKQSGFPRFRAKNRFRTIQFGSYGDGCKLGEKIYIQHIGQIRCIFHRPIPSDYTIKTMSITLGNQAFINITCERKSGNRSDNTKVVGIDFGIQSTMTTSDGDKFVSPTFTKDQLKNIQRLHRRKRYDALNKIHNKIRNQRKDFNHKLSRSIINGYGIICLENLSVEGITSFKHVNRRLYDLGINQLINFIVYKAESAGKYVVLVDPAYTSQTCSECGEVKPKQLKERIHDCKCGCYLDRDVNAAINIKRLGLQSLGVKP